MNRSNIEWCDYTWNPVTGCRHGCEYCYANKMTRRFSGEIRLNKMAMADYKTVPTSDGSCVYVLEEPMKNEKDNIIVYPFGFEPTYHRYRLDWLDNLKNGHNIFVGAMADMFGDWVPGEWITEIFRKCQEHPQNNYLFLTKNPDRYLDMPIPAGDNFWYGTTVTNAEDVEDRVKLLLDRKQYNTFLSIEPLLDDLDGFIPMYFDVGWVIIGAETGGRKGKVVPKREWIDKIVAHCRKEHIPVFMKDSLAPIMAGELLREYPPELMRTQLSQKMEKKLYAECCICKRQLRKSDMLTLMGRIGRGDQPKQFGWMCRTCFLIFSKDNGLDPDLFRWKGEDYENTEE